MQLFDLDKALIEFNKKGIRVEVLNIVKPGKEAMVYRVKAVGVDMDGDVVALKLYKNYELRSFQNVGDYIAGKYIRKPSLRNAVKKGTGVGKKFIQERWVGREFYLLKNLYERGAFIPKPYEAVTDAILMEYVGNEYGSARALIDTELGVEEAGVAFDKVVENLGIFLEFGVVHGDLSAYNILWWNDKPYIIDFPQAVNVKENPNAVELLRRDVHNVCSYFGKYFEVDEEEVFRSLKWCGFDNSK